MFRGHKTYYHATHEFFGRWGGAEEGTSLSCGRGTDELVLEGAVGEEEFRALCRGEKSEGRRIVEHKRFRERGC